MNTSIKALFSILTLIFSVSLISPAIAASSETQSQIATCKTFPVKFWNEHTGGSFVFHFEESQGKLKGFIKNAEGMISVDPTGEIENITLEGNRITFEGSSDISYDLEFNSKNCNLGGSAELSHPAVGLVISQVQTDRSKPTPVRNKKKETDDFSQDEGA